MKHATFFLTAAQYAWLAQALPRPTARTGRPALGNQLLLPGIVFVLKTGCRWKDIPPHLCRYGYVSCWRRLRYWQARGALHAAWQSALDGLERQSALDPLVCQLDGSLVQAPHWRDACGYSGKHRRYGTKLSLVVDFGGTPLAGVLTAGNRNDAYSAAATVLKLAVSRDCQPCILNADKGYDSSRFRAYLEAAGIVANIPLRSVAHRQDRLDSPPTSYDAGVGTLRVRVERTFAWLKYYRRLRYRWERHLSMFQAFVELGCTLVCLRKGGEF
ncbi:MAG TPA: IS5 family transposase [Candidatus Saccharimonadales bacterium]|jgi:transposase